MPLRPEEREFVRRVWERKKPWTAMTYLELERLYEWFLDRCRELDIDPATIDFEMIVDSTLTYYENQARLEQELIGVIPTPAEFEELEYYKKRVEELEKRIRELEKLVPAEEIERLRAEVRKWKKRYEEAKRTIEKVKRTPGLTEEDVAKLVRENVKEVGKYLVKIIKSLALRVRDLERAVAEMPKPTLEIPPEVLERAAMPTLPPPKVRLARCINCGKAEPQFVEETLLIMAKLFGFPSEYWYYCDECREKKLGLLPPENYLQDLTKPQTVHLTPIPPEYFRWVVRASTMLKRAKGKLH